MELNAVLGALGTFVTIVAGVLGGWYLRVLDKKANIRQADANIKLAELNLQLEAAKLKTDSEARAAVEVEESGRKSRAQETADDRKERKDLISEQREAIEYLKTEREEYRKDLHDVRDRLHAVTVELAVCKTELATCRADHDEQKQLNAAMLEALTENGIKVLVPGAGSKPHRPLGPQTSPAGGSE
jgi:chromosome segregation ATPase